MREYWVYELRAGDWLYIGMTSNPKQRFRLHRSGVRNGSKAKHWDEALSEYPDPHQWSMEVVAGPYDTEEEAMIEEARRQDEHWEMPGRLWRNKGAKMGPEVLEHHRERMQSEAYRVLISEKNTGKTHSDETKAKIAAAMTGKPSPMKGKAHSPESKAKLSLAISGDNHHRCRTGQKHSLEARNKMTAAKKAYWARKRVEKFFEWLEQSTQ